MSELAFDMAEFPEPSAEDISAARVAARRLSTINPDSASVSFTVEGHDRQTDPITVPRNIFSSIVKLLIEVGNGNAVQIVPVQAELTTQQAADLLNISRPHLIKLLERNEIPHRMVGTHRKIMGRDALAYREKSASRQRERLAKMVEADVEMGLYDEKPVGKRES